jgi:hypothetical protein
MSGVEKRKNPRIPVSVPVSCVSIDQEGSPLNYNMGVVKDVSQSGLALEVYCELVSDLVLLSFVDIAGTTLELRGMLFIQRRAIPEQSNWRRCSWENLRKTSILLRHWFGFIITPISQL